MGLSVGHPGGSGGSIGPFVQLADGRTAFLCVTSVLVPKLAAKGDLVHQPGPVDQEILTGRTRVATLSHILPATAGQTNRVDVAAAVLLDGVTTAGNVVPQGCPDSGLKIGNVLKPAELSFSDDVAFVGRTSGFSHGRVTALDCSLKVQVSAQHDDTRAFEDAIEITGESGPFSLPGDGGALVYRRSDGGALGMIFASTSGTVARTYLLPLQAALDAVGATLLGAKANSEAAAAVHA